MKVKIIKCSFDIVWYKNNIGEIFEVKKSTAFKNSYEIIKKGCVGGILIEDCIDIRELKLERILNESQNNKM